MDIISKACAEGKCFKCSKPWSCCEHFKPCTCEVQKMTFRGQELEYATAEELSSPTTKEDTSLQC